MLYESVAKHKQLVRITVQYNKASTREPNLVQLGSLKERTHTTQLVSPQKIVTPILFSMYSRRYSHAQRDLGCLRGVPAEATKHQPRD